MFLNGNDWAELALENFPLILDLVSYAWTACRAKLPHYKRIARSFCAAVRNRTDSSIEIPWHRN